MKPDSKALQDLLAKLELCRSTVDSAVSQLTTLEKAVRHLLNGSPLPGHPEAVASSSSKIRRTKATFDRAVAELPTASSLIGVPCPSCQAPMEWRQNKTERRWFAGCSMFSGRNGCRGTRTREQVEQWNERERDGSSGNCTCTSRDPYAKTVAQCPVGKRFGVHNIGMTMAQAVKTFGHAGQQPRETHIAKSQGAVDLAAKHMTSGFEGMMNDILEKHHGTEAVLEQYQTTLDGNLIVDDAGRPVRRDGEEAPDDDLGVPF